MINTELYELAHGQISADQQAHIDTLNNYFKGKREHVVEILLLPNFSKDKDMTNFVHAAYPATKPFNIYRGLICELRQNYPISAGDIQFIYPQLLKQRGVVELPKDTTKETAIMRIKDVKEMQLMDVKSKIGKDEAQEMVMSPLYNNISIYETTYLDNEWGTNMKKYLLGYDLSCDKFVLNYWHYTIVENNNNAKISDVYNSLIQTKIQGDTVQKLVNELCKGLVEYITGHSENELNFINDFSTNTLIKKDKEFFVFNHGVNLMGMQHRPVMLETTKLAGLKIYKSLVNNAHPYNFVFPYDAGFTSQYHAWDRMNEMQRERLQKTFYWDKGKVPFNTYLLSKVNPTNTDKFRQVETKLQVMPSGFYNTVFSRISTHDVYQFLSAEDIIRLQPGDGNTKIEFPISSKHVISRVLLDQYEKFEHLDIFNPEYYNKQTKRLVLPRKVASLILNYQ